MIILKKNQKKIIIIIIIIITIMIMIMIIIKTLLNEYAYLTFVNLSQGPRSTNT